MQGQSRMSRAPCRQLGITVPICRYQMCRRLSEHDLADDSRKEVLVSERLLRGLVCSVWKMESKRTPTGSVSAGAITFGLV